MTFDSVARSFASYTPRALASIIGFQGSQDCTCAAGVQANTGHCCGNWPTPTEQPGSGRVIGYTQVMRPDACRAAGPSCLACYPILRLLADPLLAESVLAERIRAVPESAILHTPPGGTAQLLPSQKTSAAG